MSKQKLSCPADLSENLIVDTEYLNRMANFFTNTSEKAELQLDELIERLENANQNAIVSGKMAEALSAFISLAGQMKDKILKFGSEAASLATGFRSKIQELDPPAN